MGCINKILNNPIVKPVADVAAIATGNPELIPLINGGLTLAGGVANGQGFGKSLGQGALSGAESFAGQELLPVAGNAFSSAFPETAGNLGISGGANSLTDALGQTTGGGSWTGPGTIGGDALGISNAAGLTDSSGGASTMLSRALTGGSAADSSGLAPSVTGGTANAAPLSGGGSSGGVPSNSLASPTLAGTGGGASSYSGTPYSGAANGNIDLTSADPSLTANPSMSGVGGTPKTGMFSNMFSAPNAATGNYDINGGAAGASSYDAPTQLSDAAGAAISPGNASSPGISSGGSKMGLGLNALGTLLGGANSLYANNQAKNALISGQNKAMGALQPYLNTGGAANTQLSSLLGTNPDGSTMSSADILAKSPQYQFQLDQGNQELDRQNAARGGYFSGGAIKAGQNFAAGLANQTAQQYEQNLAQQAGMGANAANNAGNIFGNTGAAKANADISSGNMLSSTLGSMLGSGGYNPYLNGRGFNPYVNAMRSSY